MGSDPLRIGPTAESGTGAGPRARPAGDPTGG